MPQANWALGLRSALSLCGVTPARAPVRHGRRHALGAGKDSTAGHRELMGLVASGRPLTHLDGFPETVTTIVRRAAGGRGMICNRADNGIEGGALWALWRAR